MRLTNDFKDYKIIDAGNGEKLEDLNRIIRRRPDPQAMWDVPNYDEWKKLMLII